MTTIVDLIRGTQQVLPTAFNNYDSDGIGLDQLKVVNFIGLKTKQFNSVIRSSTGKKGYTVSILFTGVLNPLKDKPSAGKNNCLVRCSCQSYYFWCAWANKKAKALLGGRIKPYIRKTPPPPKGLPYKNPKDIPMICKHLIFLSKVLQEKNIIT